MWKFKKVLKFLKFYEKFINLLDFWNFLNFESLKFSNFITTFWCKISKKLSQNIITVTILFICQLQSLFLYAPIILVNFYRLKSDYIRLTVCYCALDRSSFFLFLIFLTCNFLFRIFYYWKNKTKRKKFLWLFLSNFLELVRQWTFLIEFRWKMGIAFRRLKCWRTLESIGARTIYFLGF